MSTGKQDRSLGVLLAQRTNVLLLHGFQLLLDFVLLNASNGGQSLLVLLLQGIKFLDRHMFQLFDGRRFVLLLFDSVLQVLQTSLQSSIEL